MDFKIVVRSYKRADRILQKTLKELSQQKDLDLGQQLVLVLADKSEYRDYMKVLKDFPLADILISGLGGHVATNFAVDHFPEGEPIMFMDDDLHDINLYTKMTKPSENSKPLTEMGRLMRYAFKRMIDSPLCTMDFFRSWEGNWNGKLNKPEQPFFGLSQRAHCGAWWAGLNTDLFKTQQSHEDDNIRTARILHEYGGLYSLNWVEAGAGTWGGNPGGMQASTDRGVDRRQSTFDSCVEAYRLPYVREYFREDPDFFPEGMHSLVMKKEDIPIKYWSSYFQDEPDVYVA